MRAEHQRGQAAVELIGVAAALAVALMFAWQVIVAAQAWQAAQGAARAAARAGSVGAPIVRAAHAVLPAGLAGRAVVDRRVDVGRDTVRVRVDVPRVIPFIPPFGTVEGSAEIAR